MIDLDQLAGVMERMALVMSEIAGEHRGNGDDQAAMHCAGAAEAWYMAATFLRLQPEHVPAHRLESVK